MATNGMIDKLAWIQITDGKVLCARSIGKNTFYMPGGKREPGESDQQALVREIREELSVELLPESMHYLGTFEAQADGKKKGILVQMTCYTAEYQGVIEPASEIEEAAWLSNADKERCSLVAKHIFDWLYRRGLLAD